MIDIQDLRVFSVVAREGSFLGASKKLLYAQPHISSKIQQMEEELGTPLFFRSNRGVKLTPKGEQLLTYADEILQKFDSALNAVRDQGEAIGTLKIGAIESIAQKDLPHLLSLYHKQNPKVHLSVATDPTAVLIPAVLGHTLDAAFISGEVHQSELDIIPFRQEKVILVTSIDNPAIKNPHDLENQTFLMHSKGGTLRNTLTSFLNEYNVTPKDIVEFDSMDVLIANICAGFGISVLPQALIERLSHKDYLQSFDLPAKYAELPTHLVYRKDRYMDTAFANFIELIK